MKTRHWRLVLLAMTVHRFLGPPVLRLLTIAALECVHLCVCALILTRMFLSIPVKLAHLITSFLSCFISSLIMSCCESMAKLLQNRRVWKIPLSCSDSIIEHRLTARATVPQKPGCRTTYRVYEFVGDKRANKGSLKKHVQQPSASMPSRTGCISACRPQRDFALTHHCTLWN
jgi:hypothetical protein